MYHAEFEERLGLDLDQVILRVILILGKVQILDAEE